MRKFTVPDFIGMLAQLNSSAEREIIPVTHMIGIK